MQRQEKCIIFAAVLDRNLVKTLSKLNLIKPTKSMYKNLLHLRAALVLFCSMLLAVLGHSVAVGQGVTTSTINGFVTDDKGSALPGATVVAVHLPSGTRYGSVTNEQGRYNFPTVRIGGPYRITVTFVGFREQVKEGFNANLGSAVNVDFKLADESSQLNEVVVTGSRSDIFSSDRTGAATSISTQQLQTLPTVTRQLSDFTRLTPQGNGSSFGGQDSRFNNITVDGSVFNSSFGLGTGNQPGTRTGVAPISIDAIEEVQVSLAPYDVRQGSFAGAGINAVTRSGTNEFSGSAFHFQKSPSLIGKTASDLPVVIGSFKQTQSGFRLGGPIVKNKLFFFVNGEFDRRTEPATTWVATRPGTQQSGNISRTLASDLDNVSQFLQQRFNYTTGPYENFDNAIIANKLLAKIDWNINDNHKLSVRYSYLDSDSDQLISNSNSLGFGNRRTNINSMSFENSGYIINEDIQSVIAQLNSNFKNKFANNLIVGYTYQNEDRGYKGSIFPTVDVLSGNQNYLSFGFDPFTPNNKLNYSTFQLQDNFQYFAGKHTLTAGVNLERIVTNNVFNSGTNGVYIFNSLNDFYSAANAYLDNPALTQSPVTVNRFQLRYSLLPGGAEPVQQLKIWYYGAYLQDEWQANDRLKITLGLRGDVPSFENTAYTNSYIDGLTFRNPDGSPLRVQTGKLPDAKVLFSPRLGFNFDVKGDKTVQVRGGTGIFTGRPPFVWISNQVGNNGVLTGLLDVSNSRNYPFVADPSRFIPANPTSPISNTAITFDIAATSQNFRFPQVWRSNLALDTRLPFGIIGTLEGLFTKTLNNANYIDANREPATGTFTGPDQRPRFPGSGLTGANLNNAIRINDRVVQNIVLGNTNKGYAYSLTAKLERPFGRGFNAMVAYTYGQSKDIVNPGSVASGSWTSIRSIRGNNYPDLAFSDFDQRHRAIGSLSYRKEYGGRFGGATQIGLFMEARNIGRYTYSYGGDMNGDGVTNNDLIYVPNNASEITFLPLTAGSGPTSVTFTAAQQQAAWDAYINQDEYLSSRRGQYAERNGGLLPWIFQADLSLVQEFYVRVGGKRNSIQFRVDVQNVGNLLNDNWGVFKIVRQTQPISYAGVTAQGVPQFRLVSQTGADGRPVLPSQTFTTSAGTGSVYQAQLGLRYTFN